MPNYNNGKIYKLVSPNTDMIYIGSTCETLKRRFIVHKSNIKKGVNISSKNMFIWNDCTIELIEMVKCICRKELLEKEQYYIELYSDYCINIKNACCDIKQVNKNYRESEKGKNFILKNKANKAISSKKSREKYKEKLKTKREKYYNYQNSMGGDPRYNNCLARIDPTLFS